MSKVIVIPYPQPVAHIHQEIAYQ